MIEYTYRLLGGDIYECGSCGAEDKTTDRQKDIKKAVDIGKRQL